MANYAESLEERILRLLKTNLGSANFKMYYRGDPFLIPQSLLPAVVVERVESRTTFGPTGMDNKDTTIRIKLVYNKKDDFGRAADVVGNHQRIQELAEGLDPTTGEQSLYSVIGLLRKEAELDPANTSVDKAVLDNEMTVRYGVFPRPEQVITDEAHIICRFSQLVTVTGRT